MSKLTKAKNPLSASSFDIMNPKTLLGLTIGSIALGFFWVFGRTIGSKLFTFGSNTVSGATPDGGLFEGVL